MATFRRTLIPLLMTLLLMAAFTASAGESDPFNDPEEPIIICPFDPDDDLTSLPFLGDGDGSLPEACEELISGPEPPGVIIEEPKPEPTEPPYITPCDDGRINTNVCEPVAIYLNEDDDGEINIEVWDVRKGDDIGEFAFFVSADDLAALPESPEKPVQVVQDETGFAMLYKLPSGEFQVNAGPDYEGKMFEFRFELKMDEQTDVTTFMTSG